MPGLRSLTVDLGVVDETPPQAILRQPRVRRGSALDLRRVDHLLCELVLSEMRRRPQG